MAASRVSPESSAARRASLMAFAISGADFLTAITYVRCAISATIDRDRSVAMTVTPAWRERWTRSGCNRQQPWRTPKSRRYAGPTLAARWRVSITGQ
jgi:hypothetical protein